MESRAIREHVLALGVNQAAVDAESRASSQEMELYARFDNEGWDWDLHASKMSAKQLERLGWFETAWERAEDENTRVKAMAVEAAEEAVRQAAACSQ
eukprot:5364839-Prymnesium_polylepis.2